MQAAQWTSSSRLHSCMARIAETLDLFQPIQSHKYVATKAEGKATSVFVW